MSRPADRCPGVLRTHPAADGRLARVRLPGGRIAPAQLEALALAAEDFGDGHIELTVRANLQVRGIGEGDTAAFAGRLADAGLLPSGDHDRVRNVTVSPLSGRSGGRADLWGVADALDAALLAAPWTHALPGRLWFGLDDGRGDVLARTPDLAAQATGDATAELVVAGRRTGRVVGHTAVPGALLTLAREFLGVRDGEWRVHELPAPGLARLLDAAAEIGAPGHAPPLPDSPSGGLPGRVGWLPQDDGAVLLGAVLAHGRLSSRQARFAAAIGAPLLITADREILIADLSEPVAETVVKVLAPLGFVFDADSPWTRLSACTGAPGCASSRADVRGELGRFIAGGGDVAHREHWVGCERGCGAPPGAVVRTLDGP